MNKISQRKNTNGVAFLSGESSVFSSSTSKPIGIIQFFSSKVKITTKVKLVVIFIIKYEGYVCTLHPHPNPRILHEAIGVSIGMNSPPIIGCYMYMLNLPINPATNIQNIDNSASLNKKNNSEFSVSRRVFNG